MITRICLLLVFWVCLSTAQRRRPNGERQNNQWNNGGSQLNRPNQQGPWSSQEEQDGQEFGVNQSWNSQENGDNENRPWNGQQNRPWNGQQNRPWNGQQNRPWNGQSTSTTRRTTTSQSSSTTSSTSSSGSTSSDFTTTASPAFTACMSMCRTPSQYNPVCGTNSRTYSNEQQMNCAINCGANVQLAFRGACDPA